MEAGSPLQFINENLILSISREVEINTSLQIVSADEEKAAGSDFFFGRSLLRAGCREGSAVRRAGWCRAEPGVKEIQAGELELRHLSCNGNQNNRKGALLRSSPDSQTDHLFH